MDQWYVNAEALAKPALECVKSGETKFVPKSWENTFFDWMENIQPWCISRQLMWGHQIPSWYASDGTILVADSSEEANLMAQKKYGKEVSVVFLCGYRSDKSGNKAVFIESLRKKIGFEYLRFDYSGHGKSSGEIEKLLISDWINESKILIERLTN